MSSYIYKKSNNLLFFRFFRVYSSPITRYINTSISNVASLKRVIVELRIERVFDKYFQSFFKTIADPNIYFFEFNQKVRVISYGHIPRSFKYLTASLAFPNAGEVLPFL